MTIPVIHDAAKFSDQDAAAIKAVAAGNASPGQQKQALLWIMEEASGAWRDSISPGQPDVSNYFIGRRSVALQITAVLRSRPVKKETK